MDNYQIGLLAAIVIVAIGAIIAAVRVDKEGRTQVLGFASVLLVSLVAILQVNISVKTSDTGAKIDTAIIKQAEIAEKADTAVVVNKETKAATDEKLHEIKKATEDTREIVQTKLNP